MPCLGNQPDHCCYVNGQPCPHIITDHLDDEGQLRKWACGLRAELGNWDAVLADPRYLSDVAPVFEPLGINCRDWPENTDNDADFSCPCSDL